MNLSILATIAWFLGPFAPLAAATSIAIQPTHRTFEVPYSWNLNVKKVEVSGGGSVTFLDASTNRLPAWSVSLPGARFVVLEKGFPFSSERTFNVRVLTEHVVLRKKTQMPSRLELSLEGWADDFAAPALEGERSFQLVPGKALASLVAHAVLVRAGEETPEEFMKVPAHGLERQREELLKNALWGEPFEVAVPMKLSIQFGASTVVIDGALTIARRVHQEERIVLRTGLTNRLKENHEKLCTRDNKDPLNRRFCRLVLERLEDPELRNLVFSGWRKADRSLLKRFRDSVDKEGRTLLMLLIPRSCGMEEKVGASGFSSGASSIPAEKRALLKDWPLEASSLDEKDFSGRTALDYAFYFGCEKEADWLIERGAGLRGKDHYGVDRVHFALAGGSDAQVEKVLAANPGLSFDVRNTAYPGGFAKGEMRESYEPPAIPIFENATPIGSAYANRRYKFLEKMLARKPRLESDAIFSIYFHALSNKDAELLKLLIKYGLSLDVPRKIYTQDPVLSFLQHDKTSPEERAKQSEFYGIVEQLRKKRAANSTEKCRQSASLNVTLNECVAKAGMCEEVTNAYIKDKCYATAQKCDLVKSPEWSWRCKASKNFYSEGCDASGLDELEKRLCRLYGKDQDESLKAFEELLATREGSKKLFSDFGSRGSSLREQSPANLDKVCRAAKFLGFVSPGGHAGYHHCGSLITDKVRDRQKKMAECDPEKEDAQCTWLAIAMQASSSEAAYRFLEARCKKGEVLACEYRPVNFTEAGLAESNERCEALGAASRCVIAAKLPNATKAKKVALERALEGDFSGLHWLEASVKSSEEFGLNGVENNLGKLTELCKTEKSACRILLSYRKARPGAFKLEEMKSALERQVDICLKTELCAQLGELVISFPDLQARLGEACKVGNSGACLAEVEPHARSKR